MRISVAVALPACQEVVEVEVPAGAIVRQALDAAAVADRFPELDVANREVGVWSRRCARDTVLREGDRVEVYRPLAADAKAMRRARVRRGTRSRSAS